MEPTSGGRSHERSLLLDNGEDQDDCHSLEEHSTDVNATPPLYTLFLCFMALHFLISFNEMILVAPLIKLFENSLCFSYYDIHDPSVISPGGAVQESLCKIPEIQVPLATIRGWKSFCDTIPVLLLAIPYGKLGDRIGHRKVMSMSLIGIAASLIEIFIVCSFPRIFPLQLVWLSSIFLLFGGGLYPFAANMWAMASEAIPEERRSVTFYYMFSAFYVAELVASFIATVTTEISPWIPCGLAFGSLFVNLFLLWVMPDPRKSSHYLQNRRALGDATTASTKQVLADGIHAALTNRNILLTIPVFLVGTVRFTTLQVLIQYASVRFGMKVSRGASFYTEAALVTIFLFLFLIPRTCDYIRKKYNVRPQLIDLVLARMSVMCLFTGAILLGLAPSFGFIPIALLIFSAGFGTRASALSLVSYWISDSSKATLFAGIAVLENIGHAVGDPGMMQVLALALRLPPSWLGLPFFVVSAIYSLAIVSTWFIRLDKDEENDRRED